MNRETVLELLEARKALEVSNASLAAGKRTDRDLAAFEAILERMSHHIGDEEEGEKADLSFHLTLARATHNGFMVKLLETISEQMEAAIKETRRLYLYADKSVSEQLWREHREIYLAIKERDAAKAEACMRKHLFHVEKVLVRFLKK